MTVSVHPDHWPRSRSLLLYGALALVAALVELASSARVIPAVLHGNLIDPDSYMRLVRIRQGLAAGHLLNVVHGDDSGMPLVVEWSRLFDGLIVALAAPFAPFIGWPRALYAAGVATGPLSAGLLGAGLGFAAAPLTGRKWLWAAPMIGLLLPGVRAFAVFGIIHYHIAQVALTAITIGCVLRAGSGSRAMAWAAGVVGGFSIWLMPETMPFVLLSFGALGYVWLFQRIGFIFARLGLGFAATLWVALWLDPPYGGMLAPEIDRLSIVYAMLGIAVAAAGLWLHQLDRMADGRRRAVLGIGGAAIAFALWLTAFPTVALGPYGLISPADMKAFFGQMVETQPIHGVAEGLALLIPGALGIVYCLIRVWWARTDRMQAGIWLILGGSIVLASALTARMIIFQQYPAAFAAGLAPVALHDISTRLASRPRRAAMMRIGFVWLPMFLVYIPTITAQARGTNPATEPAGCSLRHIAPLMRPADGRIVLTSPNDVPELLYRSGIIGVGSLYHHGVASFIRAWDAWRTPAGSVEPEAVKATGASFVLFCAAGAEKSKIAAGAPPDSLWRALAAGHVPPWLTLVGRGAGSGYALFRIDGPSTQSGN